MIVVIADDLSGAAELAGAALNRGLTAEVQTTFTPATNADVVCVDADSRSLPDGEAARVVGEIAGAVANAKPEWIYKKCDSVLRGNVLAEVHAIMAATSHPRAVLISANPTRGRVIRDGEYFIHDQLLHTTAFASDPEHPRHTARVASLLGGDLNRVQTPDATSTDDLVHQARRLATDTLPVGGVEFFDAILATRKPAQNRVAESRVATRATQGAALLVCSNPSEAFE